MWLFALFAALSALVVGFASFLPRDDRPVLAPQPTPAGGGD